MVTGVIAISGGAGDTASSGRRLHEALFKRLKAPVRVAVLETPAGFELNSSDVARRVAEFFQSKLQNFHPEVDVIPARHRGAEDGTDNPFIIGPLRKANVIYMGAGSPTYAVRHLSNSLAWYTVLARHRQGAIVSLTSAGTVAAGAYTLPVYEIYKVGQELHWQPGLDLLGPYGLNLAFVSHWNNAEGGETLDTSRCFMGKPRMDALRSLLPDDVTIVGVDEHTSLIFDLEAVSARVVGKGGVTLMRASSEETYPSASAIFLNKMGEFHMPEPSEGIPSAVWNETLKKHGGTESGAQDKALPRGVIEIVEQREKARQSRDWSRADALRDRLKDMGYAVEDTSRGPRVQRVRR